MRILLVLACGPGASTVYDTTEVDIARSKGGGAGRSVTAQVHRTVWAACAEAALEIARAVFELQPRGAQVAILLVGAGESGGKVVPVNGWGPKEQSLSKVFAGLELATCSDAPIDAAKAGEAAGHMATDALPARGAGAGGSSSSDCRILFISSPEAVGVTVGEAGGAAARVAAAVEQAVGQSASAATSDVAVDFLWVVPNGSNVRPASGASVGGGTGQVVPAGLLKATVSRAVARHLRLQCVRITGIPMKDGESKAKEGEKAREGAASPKISGRDGGVKEEEPGGERPQDVKRASLDGQKGSRSDMYDVELLGWGEEGDPQEIVLKWQPLKALEKHINVQALPSRSIKQATALNVWAKPTQTLLKHIKQKPAALIAASAPPALPLPAGVTAPKVAARVWVLRDQNGAIFLHELLLGWLPETRPLPASLGHVTQALNLSRMDAETSTALTLRVREMVKNSALPVPSAIPRDPAPFDEVADVEMDAPSRHVTTAAIERRTRYLPVGERASFLYANSGAEERSTRSTAQALHRPMVVGEMQVGKGGEITAPRKQKIKGLKEFVETCLTQDVPPATAKSAVETLETVHKWMGESSRAGIVNGWGSHELRTLWNEMVSMGSRCAAKPYLAKGAHLQILRALAVLGVQPDPESQPAEGAMEELEGAEMGGKRKAVGGSGGKSTRPRRTHNLPVDDMGKVKLPIQIGVAVTIVSLGVVRDDNVNFHNDKYIWPVGYQCKRNYFSTVKVDTKVDYFCEVLDGGFKPLFKITPPDNEQATEVGTTASGVWSAIMAKVNSLRTSKGLSASKTAVSGPEYYGLAYPEVRRLIQELPLARNCAVPPLGNGCYKWHHFGDEIPEQPAAAPPPHAAQGAAGGRGEEGDAWKALADVRNGQQSSGRDGVGIDDPEIYAEMRRQFQADAAGAAAAEESLLAGYPDGSAMRLYWSACLAESRVAAPLAAIYDMSRHTARK